MLSEHLTVVFDNLNVCMFSGDAFFSKKYNIDRKGENIKLGSLLFWSKPIQQNPDQNACKCAFMT